MRERMCASLPWGVWTGSLRGETLILDRQVGVAREEVGKVFIGSRWMDMMRLRIKVAFEKHSMELGKGDGTR